MRPFRTLKSLPLIALLGAISGCEPFAAKDDAAAALAERRKQASEQEALPLTPEQIKQAVGEVQQTLPIEIDDDLKLTQITCDFNGSVTFWYRTSDELTRKFRAIGTQKFKAKMKESIEKIDLDGGDLPPEIVRIIRQDDISLQYVFEDRYQTHLGSFSVNGSSVSGGQHVGSTQTNPFAVRKVSANAAP